jgi:hypothetical protein
MIAALFVSEKGPYIGLAGVDPWTKERDARKYAGPYPVVAHPPCERWGRYWFGGPSAKVRRELGDDDGCFAAALNAVRKWGGVLEHPAHSYAWKHFGLIAPPMDGGWVVADFQGGWTCHVEQGNYGHRARKATWLYACRVKDLPSLIWGKSAARARLDDGYHSKAERERERERSKERSGHSVRRDSRRTNGSERRFPFAICSFTFATPRGRHDSV